MTAAIIAYFFTIIVAGQEHPVLAGPYVERCDCDWAQEWAEKQGYETETCSVMSHPQEAVPVTIGYLPPVPQGATLVTVGERP